MTTKPAETKTCVHYEEIVVSKESTPAVIVEIGTCRNCGRVKRYETKIDSAESAYRDINLIKEGDMAIKATDLHPLLYQASKPELVIYKREVKV